MGQAYQHTRMGRFVFCDAGWLAISRSLRLSGREFEIIQAVFDGDSEFAISLKLGVSQHTVHTHMERVYRKLKVTSRVELVVRIVAEHTSLACGSHRPTEPWSCRLSSRQLTD